MVLIMPSIQFPSVPLTEGVPNLARSANSLLQTTGATGHAMGLTGGLAGTFLGQYLNSMLAPTYALIDSKGKKVIQPDGPGEFEMKGDSSVSTYPVEEGGFQSYNKVLAPEDLNLSLLCGGQGPMSREAFLSACAKLKSDPVVIKLVTPDRVFPYVTCTGMSYKKSARSGVTLLSVSLTFKEVRVVATASFPKAKTDSGQAQQDGGQAAKSKIEKAMDDWGITEGLKKVQKVTGDVSSSLEGATSKVNEGLGDVGRYFGKYGIG